MCNLLKDYAAKVDGRLLQCETICAFIYSINLYGLHYSYIVIVSCFFLAAVLIHISIYERTTLINLLLSLSQTFSFSLCEALSVRKETTIYKNYCYYYYFLLLQK